MVVVVHTRVLPLAGGLADCRFRGPVPRPEISALPAIPLSSTVAMWREAGIVDVQFRLMSLGGGVVMWGRKRG
jgi:hypothetical protein